MNVPYTREQVKDLPKGLSITRTPYPVPHPKIVGKMEVRYYPNRRERRAAERENKPFNNRALSKSRKKNQTFLRRLYN